MTELIRVVFADGDTGWINPDRIKYITSLDGDEECRVVFDEHVLVDVTESEESLGVRINDGITNPKVLAETEAMLENFK